VEGEANGIKFGTFLSASLSFSFLRFHLFAHFYNGTVFCLFINLNCSATYFMPPPQQSDRLSILFSLCNERTDWKASMCSKIKIIRILTKQRERRADCLLKQVKMEASSSLKGERKESDS